MKKTVVAVIACMMFAANAFASPVADVLKPIHQFLDAFNKGDTATGFAAYATSGDILIIDEFAPHQWSGPNAAHAWADDYGKHAAATGVTDGIVKLGAPTRTEVEKDLAYVVMPATYNYKEKGSPMTEDGQMTFVLHHEAQGWKITGWTWTGQKPHAAK
jgi:ketosteroid isomerase-like protein